MLRWRSEKESGFVWFKVIIWWTHLELKKTFLREGFLRPEFYSWGFKLLIFPVIITRVGCVGKGEKVSLFSNVMK